MDDEWLCPHKWCVASRHDRDLPHVDFVGREFTRQPKPWPEPTSDDAAGVVATGDGHEETT